MTLCKFQYPSRSQNAAKALSNWEKKSHYLLAEHVKYELYVDSLQAAMTLRFKKRGEKALEHALLKEGSNSKTIRESEEPLAGVVRTPLASSVRHRRELAQVNADGESDT
jgi:PH and SEC7 domain-containing protein